MSRFPRVLPVMLLSGMMFLPHAGSALAAGAPAHSDDVGHLVFRTSLAAVTAPNCLAATATIYPGGPGAVQNGSGWTLTGTAGNDVIVGSAAADIINGNEGNDTICALAGNDQVRGGGGIDELRGYEGNDLIWGDAAADVLHGGAGNDTLYPDQLDTTVNGGTEYDTVNGVYASQLILDLGKNKIERAFGSIGADTFSSTMIPDGATGVVVDGGDGNDSITGSAGNDTLRGNNGADDLKGGDGADSLRGDLGIDTFDGQGGADKLYPEETDVIILGGPGFDTVYGTYASTLTFDLGASGVEQALGSNGNDTFSSSILPDSAMRVVIYGLVGNDTISGSTGDDVLRGHAGNDTIHGGMGKDTMIGDAGIDTLTGDGDADKLYPDQDDANPLGGPGFDSVYGTYAARLTIDIGASGIERAYGSAGNDNFTSSALPDSAARVVIYGGAGDDTVSGSSGPDLLYGDAGIDAVSGMAGNDTLTGGTEADTFSGGVGTDSITDFNAIAGDTKDGTTP